MGQPDARRIQYLACRDLTSTVNDDRHTLANTALFKKGDTIDFFDQDAAGCKVLVGTRTIIAVCTNDAIVVDSDIDMSALSGTPCICNRTLDDVQEALDRAYECFAQPVDQPYRICPAITASAIDTPLAGQQELTLDNCTSFYEVGDEVDVICDSGLVIDGATVLSVDVGNSKIVIDDNTDLTAETNCKACNETLTVDKAFTRIKDSVITIPVCNECNDDEDCDHRAFEFGSVFIDDLEKVYLDGVRKRRGTCGTLAFLELGTFPGLDDALRFDSLVSGLEGNGIEIEIISAAGTAVTVTGTIDAGDKKISINNETGTAPGTTLAAAINADANARRLVFARFGGDGSGTPSAVAATNLAGGLDDSTGDYCTLERVNGNSISGTGRQWITFHIRPAAGNRMSLAPRDTEEVCFDYSKSA